MARHPSRRTLQALATGGLAEARVKPAVLHLFACPDCCRRLGEAMEAAGRSDPRALEQAVDRALDNALAESRRRLSAPARARSRESAERVALGGRPSEMSLAAVHALVELAASFRHDSPRRTLELARLATVYARRPEFDRRSRGPANDLRALAHAEYANALRINDRLEDAFAAVDDAAAFAAQGTGDVLVRARLLDLTATLHAANRRFDEADDLLAKVVRTYRTVGDAHLAGRALIKRGIYAGYRNEPAKALRLLEDGLTLIDGERDPVLLLAARHGVIWWTAELGRHREARRLLFAARHLYAADRNEMNQLRLRWLEGKIAGGLADCAKAEALLGEVGAAFGRLGLPYKRALVTLDLAVVLLEQGKSRQVFEALGETVGTFRRLSIHREALAALIVLHEAAERELLTVAAVQAVAGMLKRLEHLPAAG